MPDPYAYTQDLREADIDGWTKWGLYLSRKREEQRKVNRKDKLTQLRGDFIGVRKQIQQAYTNVDNAIADLGELLAEELRVDLDKPKETPCKSWCLLDGKRFGCRLTMEQHVDRPHDDFAGRQCLYEGATK